MPSNQIKPTTEELKEYVSKYTNAVHFRDEEGQFFRSLSTDPKWGPIMRYVEGHLGSPTQMKELEPEDLGVLRSLRAYQVDVSKHSNEKSSAVTYFEKRLANVDEAGAAAVAAAKPDKATTTADQVSGKTTPATTTPTTSAPSFGADDPTAFTPVFLSDKNIEDLARTGEFDIGPKEIAAFFPSAKVQEVQADQDPSTQPSLLDQLAPEQYKNNAFVKTGGGLAGANPATMQRNQIADSDLPDWEKKVLLAQLDQDKSNTPPMDQQEYERRRQEIMAQYNTVEGAAGAQVKLTQLAQQWEASKASQAGTSSLRDVVSKPYAMSASEVSSAAVALFKAGYLEVPNYDPSKKLSEQMSITSAFDPNFQKAWNAWVSDSFKDRSKSMMDILQERQTNFTGQLQLYAAAIEKKRREAAGSIRLSDPAQLREHGDQIALNQIGRKLTDVEHNQLVGYVQHLQQASQQALLDGATMVEDVDPDSRLLEAIKANNPVASDATDVANQYNVFKQLIGGPRAS